MNEKGEQEERDWNWGQNVNWGLEGNAQDREKREDFGREYSKNRARVLGNVKLRLS